MSSQNLLQIYLSVVYVQAKLLMDGPSIACFISLLPHQLFQSKSKVKQVLFVIYLLERIISSRRGKVKPLRNDHLYNKIYCLWFIR